MHATVHSNTRRRFATIALLLGIPFANLANGAPTLTDPNLAVTTVVAGLVQPTSMAFIGPNDFLILEKASGQVKRVVNGVVTATVLDLPVNSNSERGLLGIALDPGFPTVPNVYLYWTESSCLRRRQRWILALTPLTSRCEWTSSPGPLETSAWRPATCSSTCIRLGRGMHW